MPKERPILFSAPMVQALLEGRKTQTRRIVKPAPPSWVSAWSVIGGYAHGKLCDKDPADTPPIRCPYGVPGDRLWVRETWRVRSMGENGEVWIGGKDGTEWCESPDHLRDDQSRYEDWYERMADQSEEDFEKAGIALSEDGEYYHEPEGKIITRWRPSIFMPRWASRILLEITDIRVQRVQEISEEDAKAEGFTAYVDTTGIARDFNAGKLGAQAAQTLLTLRAKDNFLRTFYDLNKRAPRSENPWVWALSFRRIA